MKASYDVINKTLDITKPEIGVEILIREDKKVIWVNVDGVCRLRICQIPELLVNDSSKNEIPNETRHSSTNRKLRQPQRA